MAIEINIPGGAVQLSGNPIYVDCSNASAPAGSTDYKVLLRVISPDGKLEGAPFEYGKAPKANGTARFDIRGYVDQPVKKMFQYPVVGAHVAYPTQALNVQVQVGEHYWDESGILQQVWGSTSNVFQVLKGGLHPRQLAHMRAKGSSFFDTYIAGGYWLSPRPQSDSVHPDQFIKLWYMTDVTYEATFFIKTSFDDASESIFSEAVTIDKDYLHEFNCNPKHHGIDLEPEGKKAVKIDVWLDFDGPTSHARSFYFDWEFCERPFFFFAANSLGGIDDVFFRGNLQDQFSVNGKLTSLPPQDTDTLWDPTQIDYAKTGQNTFYVNTGWKSLTALQAYRDFLISKQAWYLYSNLTQSVFNIIPVTVAPAKKTIFDRSENTFHMTLQVAEAHVSEFSVDNRMMW